MGFPAVVFVLLLTFIALCIVLKMNVWPTTIAGKLSAVLNLFFLAQTVLFIVLFEMIGMIVPELVIMTAGWLGLIAASAGFVFGLIALIKYKDKSVLVLVSILTGVAILVFMATDFIGGILGLPE